MHEVTRVNNPSTQPKTSGAVEQRSVRPLRRRTPPPPPPRREVVRAPLLSEARATGTTLDSSRVSPPFGIRGGLRHHHHHPEVDQRPRVATWLTTRSPRKSSLRDHSQVITGPALAVTWLVSNPVVSDPVTSATGSSRLTHQSSTLESEIVKDLPKQASSHDLQGQRLGNGSPKINSVDISGSNVIGFTVISGRANNFRAVGPTKLDFSAFKPNVYSSRLFKRK
ncbi:hypothetical protein JVU11DRAFT_2961 [Chiua virens]|nr:hypothetical protein JVU11DRAFT_2961 [Chiua virens]